MTFFHINYCDYNHSNRDCDMINRPDGSGDYLFLYFMTPMKVYFGQEMTIAQNGAFLLFPPGSSQIYQAVKKFTNSYIHFDVSGTDFCTQYQIPVNEIVYPDNPEILNEMFRKINIEYLEKQPFYEDQISQLINQLFILFSRQLHQALTLPSINTDMLELFRKARIEILTHLEEEWSSEKMAALTNLSISQFYNYYRIFFHQSPKAELISARINRAKYLLRQENLSVSQAAQLSGFNSLTHFTRLFKKVCGVSPSLCRLENTDKLHPESKSRNRSD